MSINKNKPELFKALRIVNDLSQAQLAKRVGCSRSQINQLENSGRNMRVETFVKVIEALGAEVKLEIDPVLNNIENMDTLLPVATLPRREYVTQVEEQYQRQKRKPLPIYRIEQLHDKHKKACAIAALLEEPINEENRRLYGI